MFKKLIIFALLFTFISSVILRIQEEGKNLKNSGYKVTLDFIEGGVKSTARDFYIWYFISQSDTSLKDALHAYSLAYRKTPRLQKSIEEKIIAKKSELSPSLQEEILKETSKEVYCRIVSSLDLQYSKFSGAISEEECALTNIKYSQIWDNPFVIQKEVKEVSGDLEEKIHLAKRLYFTQTDQKLKVLFDEPVSSVVSVLQGLTHSQKLQLFTHSKVPKDKLLSLMNANNPFFNRIMVGMVLNSDFLPLREALDSIKVENSDSNTFFVLGINAILLQNRGYKKRALGYFKRVEDTTRDPFMRDRALWWSYLVSENKTYLFSLTESTFVDLFSIMANRILKTTPKFAIVSDPDLLPLSSSLDSFDITSPFVWQDLRSKIIGMNSEEYNQEIEFLRSRETLPHLVYFLSRKNKYQYNYFIFPYDDFNLFSNNKHKALVYSVARQESNFLPALVSTSYALGMMQIMPFNVKPFAKSMGIKDVHLFDMFDPRISLRFGSFYLEQLCREFQNPLLVAYAYNGGPGFLRRTLAKGNLFIKKRKYEPWLSMELIPYEESRLYGMKVLANYIIYSELLGIDLNIEKLLSSLLKFHKR